MKDLEKKNQAVVVTEGDVDIFRLLYEYRLLRIEHLSVLTERSPKRLHRRLLRLIEDGYVTSIRLPQQKHIYSLGSKAMPVLVEQGIASSDILAERLRVHELKELFLKHEMLIVETHAILAQACRGSTLSLTSWREGRGLYDTVTVADHAGVIDLPVRPDAFFTLVDSRRPEGANRAHFYLEADRSTTDQGRFKDKLRAYWNYHVQGIHAKKLDIRNFRVLTITLTDARARNLCALAAAALPEGARKHFLFTSLKNVSLQNPTPFLGEVCFSPRSGEVGRKYPLVPPPTSSLTEATTA